ncbi:MAG: FprA family A-type flavoprotein [Corallococcus sp.]|nr:FprA family A-type flavoprotein [Corallococcus sp.]MCM1359516.1 FprA family A-type flavoprotein [Corallococcus sp.]MCM1395108.1 FprA family A-type flavoprotein [Corallococcus sp.]
MNTKVEITRDIRYIGVNDHEIDLFEGLYDVPNGMAYNSYVIIDDKIAVMDTVDARFGKEWLSNLAAALPKGRTPDYLVVQHMEPDHSSNVINFLEAYPNAMVVANAKTFAMVKNFFGEDAKNSLEVKDGETLSLGRHNLTFVFAPMVHWPEVMVTYDATDKVLFSADGFGKFGALDVQDDWACEARRYYFGIVGKYGMPVQNLLKKAAALNIEKICPLHGPILSENLGYYLNLYNTWSSYGVESDGVVVAYTSVYGHTRAAAELLAAELDKCGCKKVVLTDLARSDMAEAVEDAFRYGKLVLATTTYNAEIFPFMREFVHNLTERNYQNRTLAVIENGSWAPMAAKKITEAFAGSKNITWAGTVTILSAMTEQNRHEIAALAKELCK